MRVLHPPLVHLHIAFLIMAFVAMYTWLLRGLATSVFEDRTYRFARANTLRPHRHAASMTPITTA
ncbi:MAG: hypothetical protein O7I93_10595 [Gemmatimonadetes bacterium]|nr:hypothetical protein [Gemmatimonadota bacterium]